MTNPPFQLKYLKNPNGQVAYFFNHEFPGRPCVVFLHGLSANHTTLLQTARVLHSLNLNCLLLDLRGHGHSDKTRNPALYRFSLLGEDLKQIIAQENLTQIILIGYSFGGYVALEYLTKNPEAAQVLILISVNHVNPLKYRGLNWLTWPTYGFLRLLACLLRWQKRKKYFYFDQERSRGYWDSIFIGLTTMPVAVNFWLLSEIAHLDFCESIKQITCPTLLIKSQRDLLLTNREICDLAQKIKNAEIAIIEEKTHFLASRFKDKLNNVIVSFLRKNNLV